MSAIPVSVIVVSRRRPDALLRCLKGLEQLYYPAFEVVVVADADSVAVLNARGLTGAIKCVTFDQANISVARNLGLMQASGDVVAFIDDDAVPEPTWLDYLVEPFRNSVVAAAGGYVRGRNGISFQSRAQRVDHLGWHHAIDPLPDQTVILESKPGDGVKTEGTNCAFRCDVLFAIGEFDPAFCYFLDETDLNLRLAADGAKTAIVPLAQVHHGFAASAYRHASRMPRTLFEIGASLAVLLRKHAAPALAAQRYRDMRAEQRKRLLRHMVEGNCEPTDLTSILKTLDDSENAGRWFHRGTGPRDLEFAADRENLSGVSGL